MCVYACVFTYKTWVLCLESNICFSDERILIAYVPLSFLCQYCIVFKYLKVAAQCSLHLEMGGGGARTTVIFLTSNEISL